MMGGRADATRQTSGSRPGQIDDRRAYAGRGVTVCTLASCQ